MKHFVNARSFLLSSLVCLAASTSLGCGKTTLDGGSNTSDPSGTASGSPATSPDAATGSTADPGPAGDSPLEGHIAGRPFSPSSVELQYDKSNQQWFLSLRNYPNDCGVLTDPEEVPDEDKLVITIGDVEPAAGTYPIEYADGHAATFQVGVYDAGGGVEPSTEPVRTGALRLDSWSDAPGSTIAGHLQLGSEESSVKGTFTAKVCEPR